MNNTVKVIVLGFVYTQYDPKSPKQYNRAHVTET